MSPAEEQESSRPEPAPASSSVEIRTPQVVQSGAGNVDKIRDILFGSQMREYETRFAKLEESLVKEITDLREANRRRFDQLENYIHREFEAFQNRLRAEREERTETGLQHAAELKNTSESFMRRLRDLDDRATSIERDLRGQLLQESRNLADDIRARHDEAVTMLEKRFNELRQTKTDRAALATLFNEVALRLNDQFQIPGSEA